MEPLCPQCGTDFIQRSRRKGVIEYLLSLMDIHPFRCQICTNRFKVRQRGARYSKQAPGQRQYQRMATRLPATFSGDQAEGKGEVMDISMEGCGLETDAPLMEGSLLELRLKTSDRDPAIVVDTAVVRSVRASYAGVQFLRLRMEEKDRLSQFMRSLLATSRR